MSLLHILLIILVIVAIAGAPVWPYASNWGTGWMPSGGVGIVVILLIAVLLLRG